MSFDVYTPTRQFRIADESSFRTYTADQMEKLLGQAKEFSLTSVHDFGYDAEQSIAIDEATEDVVYVLVRR